MSAVISTSAAPSDRIVLGPGWRHATPAAAIATVLWVALGDTLRPHFPAGGEAGVPLLDVLRGFALPFEAQVAIGAISTLGACVALYDVARASALPRSAADACWWFAISPLVWPAFASPAGALALWSTALAWHLALRTRLVGAAAAALIATLCAPWGGLAWLLVLTYFVRERGWRMGLAPGGALAATPALWTLLWVTTRESNAHAALWSATGFVQPAFAAERIPQLAWRAPEVAVPALFAIGALALLVAARRAAWPLRVACAAGVVLLTACAVVDPDPVWAALPCVAATPFVAASLAERSDGATRWLWVASALASAGGVALLAS